MLIIVVMFAFGTNQSKCYPIEYMRCVHPITCLPLQYVVCFMQCTWIDVLLVEELVPQLLEEGLVMFVHAPSELNSDGLVLSF